MGSAAETEKPAGTTTDLGAEDEPELNADGTPKEKEAAPDPFADFRGPPPEGKFEAFVLPDGAVADPELQAEFTPLVSELGLSQKGAQKLVDFKTKLDQKAIKDWGSHVTGLRDLAKADPEIGGAKYEESVALGRASLAKFGTPALRAVLNHYGVGAHPEMIRYMAKVGRAMGETSALDNAGGSGAVTEKPLHEVLYTNPTSQSKP